MGFEGMGSEAHIMGSEAMSFEVMGSEATASTTASTTGIEAHGSALGSGSGHSGGRIGGRTGLAMRTPRSWWLPLLWWSSPHRPTTGTIAMPRKLTTRMSHSAPEAGER
jgi:hypothetical protein